MVGEQPVIEVVPATIGAWDDVRLVLDGSGEQGCWCQPWRGRDAVAQAAGESRPETLQRQLREQVPPPGFLAYRDGVPAGWVGVTTRELAPRLARSTILPATGEGPTWSIGCFRVRVGHRRQGVASAMLAGVIAAARAAGAPAVEAYPIDPGGKRVDVGFAFVGLVSMFDAAGFGRIGETDARSAGRPRIAMRLDLREP